MPQTCTSLHPDARLLAFGRMWEATNSEIESLEHQEAAEQKISGAIQVKMDIIEAIACARCTSPEGARVLLMVALDAARIELGDELPLHWKLVERALASIGNKIT